MPACAWIYVEADAVCGVPITVGRSALGVPFLFGLRASDWHDELDVLRGDPQSYR